MDKLAYAMDEAPDLIGIRPRLFADLVARGEIPTFKIGRRRLIAASALREYVERRQREAEANGLDHVHAELMAAAPEMADALLEARVFIAKSATFVHSGKDGWEAEQPEIYALCDRMDVVLDRIGHPFEGLSS